MAFCNKASEVRVRFAPSPTGFLHIGGARTALFNWLFARANQGKFLLRIEDTDRTRSEPRFTKDILESLEWLGLLWDEEPLFQSSRFDRYAKLAGGLLKEGLAFRCDCSTEKLGEAREQYAKEKKPFRYPGFCRDKNPAALSSSTVIRLKTSNEGQTAFTDCIRGPIAFENKDIDDWVIMRADGSPTYNFSVVIDDSDQQITHVLRGDDHINNTPKQIQLYEMLKLSVPQFAHLPMILGADRTKLSKRHGAASTLEYRRMGYLPEAVVNFLVRLGWSHGDQEKFSAPELVRYFSLDKIGKANAIFNVEKLNWVSGHWMRETPAHKLADYVEKYFSDELPKCERGELVAGIGIIQAKVKTVLELLAQLDCLFGADPSLEPTVLKAAGGERYERLLAPARKALEASDFSKQDLEARVRKEAESLGEKLSPLAQAIRFAVTGGRVSPGLFEMLELQGKDRVLRRLDQALAFLHSLQGKPSA